MYDGMVNDFSSSRWESLDSSWAVNEAVSLDGVLRDSDFVGRSLEGAILSFDFEETPKNASASTPTRKKWIILNETEI